MQVGRSRLFDTASHIEKARASGLFFDRHPSLNRHSLS